MANSQSISAGQRNSSQGNSVQGDAEMVEADVLRLLGQAARRVKVSAALKLICLTSLILLALGTLLVVASKRWPEMEGFWELGLVGALFSVLLAGVLGLMRVKPDLARIALLLDLRANLKEQLSTWYDLQVLGRDQELGGAEFSPMRKAFIEAQRKATLCSVSGVRPERLIPIEWPVWSSMLWLGFLFLGCALLMPAQQDPTDTRGGAGAFAVRAQTSAQSVGKLGNRGPKLSGVKINPLSPTDMQKARMLAMDQRDTEMILEMKNQMLDEMLAKIGSQTEFDLPEDVRDLVAQLSKQTGREKSAKPASKDGSIQRDAEGPSISKASSPVVVGVPEAAFVDEALIGVFVKRFPDIEIELRRYYAENEEEEKKDDV